MGSLVFIFLLNNNVMGSPSDNDDNRENAAEEDHHDDRMKKPSGYSKTIDDKIYARVMVAVENGNCRAKHTMTKEEKQIYYIVKKGIKFILSSVIFFNFLEIIFIE